MNKRACKGCRWLVLYYGNKDKNGKPVVSGHRCIKKRGLIKRFPKQCERKEE